MRALVLAAALTLLLAPAAHAQDPDEAGEDKYNPFGLYMAAEVVFDGRIQSNQWACVQVEVENIGDPVDGQLEIYTTGVDLSVEPKRYARLLDVGRKARKRVFLYFEAEGYDSEWTVQLVDRRGKGAVVAATVFRTTSKEPDDLVVGFVGDDPQGMTVVRETWSGAVPGHDRVSQWERRRVLLSLVSPTDMPDRWIGYNVVDILIWRQPDPTGMDPAQLEALAHFVGMGGTLVVPVTDHWQPVRDSALERLLPVDLLGSAQLSSGDALLRALDLESVPMAEDESILVADARAREGATIRAADGEQVLWAHWPYGLGQVVFLGMDPALHPIKGEVDRATFWRRLLWLPQPEGGQRDHITREAYLHDQLSEVGYQVPVDAYTGREYALAADQPISECVHDADEMGTANSFAFSSGYYYGTSAVDSWFREVRRKLNEIPALKPLPLGWLALFAVVYLLCIGPIDYVILRVIGRQEWTWLTFPLLIAVFFTAAVIGTTMAKGRNAVMTRLEVVDVIEPDGLWRGQSFVGVFSSQRTDLVLRSVQPHSVIAPTRYVPQTSWYVTDELDEGYMKRPAVQVGPGAGAMAYGADTWTMAYLNSAWVDHRAERGHFTLREDGEGLVSIVNGTDINLYSAMLVHGRTPRDARSYYNDLYVYAQYGTSPYDGGWQAYPLGQLLAGGSVQVDWKQAAGDTSLTWPTPPPQAMVRSHDQEDWNHFREMPEFWGERGHIDLVRAMMNGQLVLVGFSSTPVEEFELDGLEPVSEPRTMVRVLLGDDPRLDDLRAVAHQYDPAEPSQFEQEDQAPIISGTLSQDHIQTVVRTRTPQIRDCYERAMTRHGPGYSGDLSVKFEIDASGYVWSVYVASSTLDDWDLEQCVVNEFWGMTFPAPPGGGSVSVTYPFVFAAK